MKEIIPTAKEEATVKECKDEYLERLINKKHINNKND